MSHRKLTALGYPNASTYNPEDPKEFAILVLWLEETKIRALPPANREPLRKFSDSNAWKTGFADYLKELECPLEYGKASLDRLTHWLLCKAVNLEFSDNAESLNSFKIEGSSSKHTIVLSSLDAPQFEAEVEKLSGLLKLPEVEGRSDALKAITNLVKMSFSKQALKQANETGPTANKFNHETFPLGFETEDALVDKASTVLRLLYLKDLRDKQTLVNEVLATLQEFTANPKTDSALGRVGR